jgi:hypothetical protein
MTYYQKTNLPRHPLKLPITQELYNWHINAQAEGYSSWGQDILSDELLTIFNNLNLKVKCCILFCARDNFKKEESRIIHSDIFLNSDNVTWENYICGINWELTENKNEFLWWDTTELEKFYPVMEEKSEKSIKKETVLSGIHYGKREYTGIPPGASLLDSTQINLPTLVRTDIAHTVRYDRQTTDSNIYNFDTRVSLSVRFIPRWTTWEEACQFFKSIIL